MNRIALYRLISVIHAIKCNNTNIVFEADASFDRLLELKGILSNTSEEQFPVFRQQVMHWAGENPIATDREINELLNL